MSHFPDEILEDILCLLPVECLLRLKLVSKSLRALISSPQFVKLHLDRSAETKINLSLFLWGYKLYRVEFDSLDKDRKIELGVVDNHPLNRRNYSFQLWGSCNGLICMSNRKNDVFLWNPSTGKSIKLPDGSSVEVPNLSDLFQENRYGITFACNDYKVGRVVELRTFNGEFFDYEVMVYSLNSNSWHRSEKFPRSPDLCRTGSGNTIVGSALHWILRFKLESEKESPIVAFDLGTEKYRLVPQPEFRDPHFPAYLHSFGECLSVTCHYISLTADIWVLKNYGEKNETWLRLITMLPLIPTHVPHLMPVAYSKCGKKVLMEMNYVKLLWYNLEQKSVENIMLQEKEEEEEDIFEVITCLESLVSVDAPAAVAKNPQEDKRLGKSK